MSFDSSRGRTDIWPQALEALWNLDKTNPTLFNELVSDFAQPSSVFDAESELEFVDVIEDTSDIQLEVVQPLKTQITFMRHPMKPSAQLRRLSS